MFISFYQGQLVPPPVGGPAADFITFAVKSKSQFGTFGNVWFCMQYKVCFLLLLFILL